MNKRMAAALGAVLTSMTLITSPVLAADGTAPPAITQGTETKIFGVLTVKDGVYTLGDWTLSGDEAVLAPHVGGYVLLFGQPAADGTKTFTVRDLALAKGQPGGGTTAEPVAGEQITLEGTLAYQDLEGGFYAIEGYALVGDQAQLSALAGKRIVVSGTKQGGMSIQQMPRVQVARILTAVTASRGLPTEVSVAGKTLTFDQAAEVVDGTLMVPLRAVVEAAGGWVEWDGSAQAVHVEMPDRQAWFWVSGPQAEMNENNVRYLRRNLLDMAKAPVLKNDRVLVSADALTQILGLFERADNDAALDLAAR